MYLCLYVCMYVQARAHQCSPQQPRPVQSSPESQEQPGGARAPIQPSRAQSSPESQEQPEGARDSQMASSSSRFEPRFCSGCVFCIAGVEQPGARSNQERQDQPRNSPDESQKKNRQSEQKKSTERQVFYGRSWTSPH